MGPLAAKGALGGPVGFKPRRSGGESRNKACEGTRIQLPGLRRSVLPLLNPGPGDCHGQSFLAIHCSQRSEQRECVCDSQPRTTMHPRLLLQVDISPSQVFGCSSTSLS